MIDHRYRILALVLFALAEIAIVLLAAFDVISSDTATKIGGVLGGLFAVLGLTDAGVIESRRRDPSKPALKDDVITTTITHRKPIVSEPIPSDQIDTPGPFRVPPGAREDSNHGDGQ